MSSPVAEVVAALAAAFDALGVDDRSGMPVDVALGGPGLEQLFLDASEAHEIAGTQVRVAKAKHIVVMKLLAGRPNDLDDAEAIGRRRSLDHAEVERLVEAIAEGLGEDDVRTAFAELTRRLAD